MGRMTPFLGAIALAAGATRAGAGGRAPRENLANGSGAVLALEALVAALFVGAILAVRTQRARVLLLAVGVASQPSCPFLTRVVPSSSRLLSCWAGPLPRSPAGALSSSTSGRGRSSVSSQSRRLRCARSGWGSSRRSCSIRTLQGATRVRRTSRSSTGAVTCEPSRSTPACESPPSHPSSSPSCCLGRLPVDERDAGASARLSYRPPPLSQRRRSRSGMRRQRRLRPRTRWCDGHGWSSVRLSPFWLPHRWQRQSARGWNAYASWTPCFALFRRRGPCAPRSLPAPGTTPLSSSIRTRVDRSTATGARCCRRRTERSSPKSSAKARSSRS